MIRTIQSVTNIVPPVRNLPHPSHDGPLALDLSAGPLLPLSADTTDRASLRVAYAHRAEIFDKAQHRIVNLDGFGRLGFSFGARIQLNLFLGRDEELAVQRIDYRIQELLGHVREGLIWQITERQGTLADLFNDGLDCQILPDLRWEQDRTSFKNLKHTLALRQDGPHELERAHLVRWQVELPPVPHRVIEVSFVMNKLRKVFKRDWSITGAGTWARFL